MAPSPAGKGNAAEARPYSCVKCGRLAAYLCSMCYRSWYCSKECQIDHWDIHQVIMMMMMMMEKNGEKEEKRGEKRTGRGTPLMSSS